MAQLKKMQELGIESEFWAESSSDLVGADSSDERELRRRRRRYNDRLIAKAVRVATQQMQSRGDADDETDVRARAIDRLFDGIQPVSSPQSKRSPSNPIPLVPSCPSHLTQVHDIAESEMALINECGASTAADVYGELTVAGAHALHCHQGHSHRPVKLKALAAGFLESYPVNMAGARDVLHSLDVHATETLYDLGSGAGRFVLQAQAIPFQPSALSHPPTHPSLLCPKAAMEHPLLRCVGVELSQTRHDAATLAARRAALPNLTLVHADLLEAPLDDASHVFVASLVFRWTLDPAAAHI